MALSTIAKRLASLLCVPALALVAQLPAFGQATSPAASPNATLERAQAAMNTEHPGKAIYEKTCAACHNNPEVTKSPALDTLKSMRYQAILYALNEGKMQTQAAALSNAEKTTLIEYLVGREKTNDDWIANMMCPDRSKVELKLPATVATFGFDKQNRRHLTQAQAGIETKDFAGMELAWAIGFPKATTMRSQPAVVGNMIFLPVADAAKLFAIDVSGQPCFKWVYESDVPLRTSAAYGELPGSKRKVLVFGDLGSNIHMVDALTGKAIWKEHIGLHALSLTTGTPVLHRDRVYAPVSQYEITVGGDPKQVCCKTHGAVVALNASNGKKVWTAHTMEEATPLRDRGDGQMYWGPSGAPIWNSPSIDEKRGLLYVGTGEATSEPAHKNTDAILAINLKDGTIRWSFQATEHDIFLSGCRPGSTGLNCPKAKSVFRDVDFGASTILAKRSNGKEVLLAGQKSGTVWALDPDNGKVVWQQAFGEGSPLGGIHWGIAFDGKHVFAPINRPYGMRAQPEATQKPGMHALNVDTGEIAWTFVAEPDCTGDRQTRVKTCASNVGLSGAPTVIDGAVVEGSLDGFLRAFDVQTGAVLFKFDTAREFVTLNGVKASGGAIDSASIVAANGLLFVNSGYGMFGQMPGNVLLAFKAKAPN